MAQKPTASTILETSCLTHTDRMAILPTSGRLMTRLDAGLEPQKITGLSMCHLHQARSFVHGVRSYDPPQGGKQRPIGGFCEPRSKRVAGLGVRLS